MADGRDVSAEQLREMAIRLARTSPCMMVFAYDPDEDGVMLGIVGGPLPGNRKPLSDLMDLTCDWVAAHLEGGQLERGPEWRGPRADD